jgi:hypothetical protein
MRLSLIPALGIAAFLGTMAVDNPDANALARRTIVSNPRGTVVVTKRPGRVAMRGFRRARGAVIVSRPGRACRTVIVNGVRVRRCF